MIDLSIHDFWGLDTEAANLIKFLFIHAEHDLHPADEPHLIKIGYSCSQCEKFQHIRLMALKKTSGKMRDFLMDLRASYSTLHGTGPEVKAYLAQYGDIILTINKLHCMI